MCWSKPGENCVSCQKIFDACEHETTYINEDHELQCAFCEKTVPKNIVKTKYGTCPYCKWDFDWKGDCSQMCMAR